MAAHRDEDVSSKLENEPVGHDARAMKKATDQVRVLAAASGAGGDCAGDADAVKHAQTDEEGAGNADAVKHAPTNEEREQSPVVDYKADDDDGESRVIPEGTTDEGPVPYSEYLARSTKQPQPTGSSSASGLPSSSDHVWLWESTPPNAEGLLLI